MEKGYNRPDKKEREEQNLLLFTSNNLAKTWWLQLKPMKEK
jgi:hypothetical protein